MKRVAAAYAASTLIVSVEADLTIICEDSVITCENSVKKWKTTGNSATMKPELQEM